ncbi:MAG: ATP-dependent helicase [Bdellovibrionales bacterium]|nr:ATP-dependent helicase [Bdellovibrionales bacterium]
MSHWLSGLNPEQQEAVSHSHGPLLILAGAGSGKTTVLVSRTGRLIAERLTTPERLCVLTFTNKAANELKHRVAKKLGEPAKKVWAGTFHGFGLRFLKEHWREAGLPQRFGIIDGNDALAILKDLLRDHKAMEKERFDPENLMNKIGDLRAHGREGKLDDTIESAMAVVLAPKYQKRLRHLGVVDFEDLLLRPLNMMKENPALAQKTQGSYDFVMVDEFQDTNAVQMRLVDELTATHRNIAVVGDDDQSIYGWRGAEIRNILDFPKRYKNCHVIRLERNYRSSSNILNMANAIIATNKDRHTKVLRAGKDQAGQTPELFVYENEDMEVEQLIQELGNFHRQGYRWRDMAVLYRSNSQGGLVEGGLRFAQIPYKLTGGTALFDRKEVKDTLAYIRCSVFPSEVAFRRIVNVPARGVGEKTIEDIEAVVGNSPFFIKAKTWAKDNPEERATAGINALFEFLDSLKKQLVNSTATAEEVLTGEMRNIGYRDLVNQSYRDPQVADRRWLTIAILGRILDGMFTRHGRTLDTLERFIDLMELRDPVEEPGEAADEVQMMTLHACKGLEFPLVFLLGLEEDLLPHARLGQNVDEERRLFYVGVTRAQKHLVLTRVRERKRYGRMHPVAPSRFLLELDSKLYIEFQNGRPLVAGARESMLADLMKKLDKKIASRET